MPEVIEAPITEKDLSPLVEPSVAIPAVKFKDLVEYIAQLEDALKCTEFDLGREREFSEFLRSCLKESNEELRQNSLRLFLVLSKKWSELLGDLLEQGSIGDEQVERFQELLSRLRSIEGHGPAGAASVQEVGSVVTAAGEYNKYSTGAYGAGMAGAAAPNADVVGGAAAEAAVGGQGQSEEEASASGAQATTSAEG